MHILAYFTNNTERINRQNFLVFHKFNIDNEQKTVKIKIN